MNIENLKKLDEMIKQNEEDIESIGQMLEEVNEMIEELNEEDIEKITNKEDILSDLHRKLKQNGTPDVDTVIYLFDKMYLLETGEVIEIE